MFLIKKITFIVLGWLLLCIFFAVVIHAAVSYRGGMGQAVQVNEQGVCQKVTNSSGQDIFIPTNTSNEWLLFRQNKPSYISLDECAMNLVYNVHTDIQCVAAGGAVIDDGAGNKMCKFTASSCLDGWTQYNNWSTTIAQGGNYVNEIALGTCTASGSAGYYDFQVCRINTEICSSGSHLWSNIAKEYRNCNGAQIQAKIRGGAHNYFCVSLDCNGATNVSVSAAITQIGCY